MGTCSWSGARRYIPFIPNMFGGAQEALAFSPDGGRGRTLPCSFRCSLVQAGMHVRTQFWPQLTRIEGVVAVCASNRTCSCGDDTSGTKVACTSASCSQCLVLSVALSFQQGSLFTSPRKNALLGHDNEPRTDTVRALPIRGGSSL